MLRGDSFFYGSKNIDQKIYFIRGMRVMLDSDLAGLYGVSTKALNQAVKRNAQRFPEDFMFQLNLEEVMAAGDIFPTLLPNTVWLCLQAFSIAKLRYKQVVEIVRAFVWIRTVLSAHKELARKLDQMEKKYHNKFTEVFAVLRRLMNPPVEPKKRIGFRVEERQARYKVK